MIKFGMGKRLPSRNSTVRDQYLMNGYDGIMMSLLRPTPGQLHSKVWNPSRSIQMSIHFI